MSTSTAAARLAPGAITQSPRGTVVEILEWSPARLAIRRTLPPSTGKGAEHYHENGVERFTVIEGRVSGSVDGESRVLQAGDTMEVPAGSAHVHPHTGPDDRAVVEHVIEPLPGEQPTEIPSFPATYFASWLGWLEAGEVDDQDEPSFLQIMAVIKDGGGGSWVCGPPVVAQRALSAVVGRVANLRGIHATT
jgi:quercetin dioxygenase-like cupin family protein